MKEFLFSFFDKNTKEGTDFARELQSIADEFGLTLEETKLCAIAFAADRLENEYGIKVK